MFLTRSDVHPLLHLNVYMNEHCREWIYNCKQLQSIASKFCGHYCACFCILRSKGVDMHRFTHRFMRYFTRDTGLNDVIVHELICNVRRHETIKRLKYISFFYYTHIRM